MLLKNLIIQTEYNNGATQWHLSNKKLILYFSLFFIALSILSLLMASLLSSYLYKKKINEYKASYGYVSENLNLLSKKIINLNNQINIIEQKDSALRSMLECLLLIKTSEN